jgi:hypothetical protein
VFFFFFLQLLWGASRHIEISKPLTRAFGATSPYGRGGHFRLPHHRDQN